MVGKIKIVQWPGKDRTVGIKILSCHDFQQADFETQKYFKNQKIDLTIFNNDEYEMEKDLRVLVRFLVEDEDGEQVFKKPSEARKDLTLQERGYFNDHYNKWSSDLWKELNG